MTPLEICMSAAGEQAIQFDAQATFQDMGLDCEAFHNAVELICMEDDIQPPVRPPVIGMSGQFYIGLFPPVGGLGN